MWAVPPQPCSQSGKRRWFSCTTRSTITRLPSGSSTSHSGAFRDGVLGLRGRYCPPMHGRVWRHSSHPRSARDVSFGVSDWRLHRLGAIIDFQTLLCTRSRACAAIRRRMRRNNKSETSRLIARQSETKSDRRLSDSDLAGCALAREGVPIGDGSGIPPRAKRCACARSGRILRQRRTARSALRLS